MCVLVTRPAHQAEPLCARLERAGARVIRFPVIAIEPVQTREPASFTGFDVAVFVSANAVRLGLERLGVPPPGVRCAAVGEATAAALERLGVAALRPVGGSRSEDLLALPDLSARAVAGRRVAIVCGEGERDLLASTLSRRGARIERITVYRRVRPQVDGAALVRRGRSGEIHAVVVTSGEGLQNLFDLVGAEGRAWLCRTRLVVVSERIAGLARARGPAYPPVVARGSGEEAIHEALAAVWSELQIPVGTSGAR